MPLKKFCCKCGKEKSSEQFYANKRMKDGLNTFCIECHRADNVARKKVQRADPIFRAIEQQKKKIQREKTFEARSKYMAQWRESNKQKTKEYSKQYREENKHKYNFLCQKRKIDLLKRTPKWLTDEDFWIIEQAYEIASLRTKMLGVSFHVDHVIPLRGKFVSGLHVPENLRVVTWLENQKKTNSYEV